MKIEFDGNCSHPFARTRERSRIVSPHVRLRLFHLTRTSAHLARSGLLLLLAGGACTAVAPWTGQPEDQTDVVTVAMRQCHQRWASTCSTWRRDTRGQAGRGHFRGGQRRRFRLHTRRHLRRRDFSCGPTRSGRARPGDERGCCTSRRATSRSVGARVQYLGVRVAHRRSADACASRRPASSQPLPKKLNSSARPGPGAWRRGAKGDRRRRTAWFALERTFGVPRP